MGAHNSHRAVGIGWNEWSASIGTRGRHPLERVVDFSGIRRNPTPVELAAHYGMAMLPARVGRPTDKGKVENAVLQAERWTLAPLRNQAFLSLAEARQAVAAQMEALNNRPFLKLPGTRRGLFETLERPVLRRPY